MLMTLRQPQCRRTKQDNWLSTTARKTCSAGTSAPAFHKTLTVFDKREPAALFDFSADHAKTNQVPDRRVHQREL